jgi:hypothetical protein
MADRLVMNTEHLDRLSRELAAMGQALREHGELLAARCGGAGDAYGSLPASHEARSKHDEAAQEMLDHLRLIEEACHSHADSLRIARRELSAVEARATRTATDPQPGSA